MIVKYFSIPHVANLFDYVRATGGGKYVLVKVPARVLYGNYWARGKFKKVM